jgi:hypothetical protein
MLDRHENRCIVSAEAQAMRKGLFLIGVALPLFAAAAMRRKARPSIAVAPASLAVEINDGGH